MCKETYNSGRTFSFAGRLVMPVGRDDLRKKRGFLREIAWQK